MTDLHVRTATLDDADALFALQPEPAFAHAGDCADLIQATLKQYPFLIAEQQSQPVGYAYATAHRSLAAFRWSVDVHVIVAGQSSDTAQTLYRSLIRHLGEQGFMAVYAAVSNNDPASAALHKALGFAPIGVHQSIDIHCEADYWCMTLATTPAREEPVSFNILQQRLGLCGR